MHCFLLYLINFLQAITLDQYWQSWKLLKTPTPHLEVDTTWGRVRGQNSNSLNRSCLTALLINKIRKVLYSLTLYKVTKTTPVRRDHMRPGPGPVRRTKVNRKTDLPVGFETCAGNVSHHCFSLWHLQKICRSSSDMVLLTVPTHFQYQNEKNAQPIRSFFKLIFLKVAVVGCNSFFIFGNN